MIFLTHRPAAPLDRFVSSLWYCRDYRPNHAKDRMLPNGTMSLIINLEEDQCRIYDRHNLAIRQTTRGAAIAGPHAEYFVIDTAEQRSVMGVEFVAGGAFPFFREPVSEFLGLHISLEDPWGSHANDLREQLLAGRSPRQKLERLEAALLARMRDSNEPHPAVEFALRQFHSSPGTAMIRDVTGRIGFSSRHFIDLFRRQVGLSPKVFCRLRRFNQSLHAVAHCRGVEWAQVALSAGYYDQAHFIHDFRAFSGITPTGYLASQPIGRHVPLPE